MAGRKERFDGTRFDIRKDFLRSYTERRTIEDGRYGIVCTLHFVLNSEERFLTFLLKSAPGQPVFLDRVEGGGSIPGRVVGVLRDRAKIEIRDFVSKNKF